MSCVMRKYVYAIHEQQKNRSACTVWSAPLFFAARIVLYILFLYPKFKPSFCGCAGWFVSYLVANSEDWVSHDEAHILQSRLKRLCYFTIEPRHDKTNKVTVRLAKTQISLGIRPVCSESSLCTQWVAKDPSFLHADNEDVDQTGRMPRLIWVFAGHTLILFVLSCRGSIFLKFCPNLIWL